ncbi:MAG: hypothetical protein FWG89_10220 [Treponema sp.]|nr:hypothetical protein [Treponema sp.]
MSIENNNLGKKLPMLRPYLSFLDSTRFLTTPLSWLYVIIAIAFQLAPIALLVLGINGGIFRGGNGTLITSFILTFLATMFAGFVAFNVMWSGKKKLSVDKITIDFIIDCFADLLYAHTKAAAHFVGITLFFIGVFSFIDNSLVYRLVLLGTGINPMFYGLNLPGIGVTLIIGGLLGGYIFIWLARLFRAIFIIICRYVYVRVFKFVVFTVIVKIYEFIAHAGKQLFDFVLLLGRTVIDMFTNLLRVVYALFARLGRFLLAYAKSPFENKAYNNSTDTNVTYNQ